MLDMEPGDETPMAENMLPNGVDLTEFMPIENVEIPIEALEELGLAPEDPL
jgi:hypothetical protein